MKLRLQPAETLKLGSGVHRAGARLAILALLIAVAGLMTLAKNSVYYSQSGSVQYVSIASKMKVSQPADAVERPLSLPVGIVVLPEPEPFAARAAVEEQAIRIFLGVAAPIRDRAPPASPA